MEEMEQHLGYPQIEATPDEIEDYVRSLGAGGHAVVGIDRVEGPGHWFNAYTPDGEHVYEDSVRVIPIISNLKADYNVWYDESIPSSKQYDDLIAVKITESSFDGG
jgi:hypothetical protein